jgi:glycosyltransferase involved in cell wall biosynthesis
MKITFVLPPVNLSGGIRVAAIYSRWLTVFGHHVVAVSPPRQISMRERVLRQLHRAGTAGNARSHFDDFGLDHRVLDRPRPVEDRDVPDADVVIATWWETAEWVASLAPAKGVKVHFVQGHEVFDWLPIDRCKAAYRLPLHKIVVADWLKRVMRTEYGVSQVDVVPNSVDHTQFFAAERGKCEHPTIGFLYSKAPLKGIDLTLKAIAMLRSQFHGLRVISFGEHMPMVGELGDVEFHLAPSQSTLRDLYARCDVWLTASRSEGFNLPAMEAMACRTPVVSTRTGWPEEAIVNGVNGWCVDINDVDGLAQGAQRVLSLSDEDWRTLSRGAFQTVEHSSWEASARMFERALVTACKSVAITDRPRI